MAGRARRQDHLRRAGYRARYHICNRALYCARVDTADAGAGNRGGGSRRGAGCEWLADFFSCDPAERQVGVALWRDSLQRTRDGGVRGSIRSVRTHSWQYEYIAASCRDSVQRIQLCRGVCRGITTGAPGPGNTGIENGRRIQNPGQTRNTRMSIEVRNLSKQFGTFSALRNVSLEVKSGELLALLGPSGSGKTTLLRVIAGLETADDGRVLFHGEDATDQHVRERQVGFVFQHYALFRNMTILENVAFGLRVRPKKFRPTDKEIRRRVHELLKLVQLDWLADRYPAQLSGGQRQRIALARALAVEPKVLLLDEPFGALDAKVRKELRRWLRRLHDELHVTSIFVTHDQEEALEVADRVVLMNSGQVEQVGSPQDVWDHPASPFVYGFLGDVNLFHGRAHEGEVHLDGMQLHSPEERQLRNGRALAYVRPHDLEIRRFAPGVTGIVATLSRAIVVGPIARLELEPVEPNPDNPGSGTIIEAQLPAQQFRDLGLQEGDTVVATPRKAR